MKPKTFIDAKSGETCITLEDAHAFQLYAMKGGLFNFVFLRCGDGGLDFARSLNVEISPYVVYVSVARVVEVAA